MRAGGDRASSVQMEVLKKQADQNDVVLVRKARSVPICAKVKSAVRSGRMDDLEKVPFRFAQGG